MVDRKVIIIAPLIVLIAIVFIALKPSEENLVVVYVSHDQDYSEPILKDFENKYGIKVKAVYDTEATKTVGLVQRLIAEKNNPSADVFWNNEVIRTLKLKEEGVLEKYCSPSAENIPLFFKDEDCYWTGFAARARVIIVNTELVNPEEEPESLYDLANPKWRGNFTFADPRFGSTGTHFAAIFAFLGEDLAKELFIMIKENKPVIAASNSQVRDLVASGKVAIGLTDTDDANDAIVDKKPVKYIFPDQKGIGTLVFPNTVMLIKGARHEKNAKALIDYLLSEEVEQKLAKSKAIQIPTRDIEVPENVPKLNEIKVLKTSWKDSYNNLEKSQKFLESLFIK
jgi:iron(III) transport system substrate-binding protein